MRIEAENPEEYIEKIPEDRKQAIQKLRKTINANLPKGFEETIAYDMIAYVVPHGIYPNGYHVNPKLPLPFVSIASQKHFIALYHSGIYADKGLHDWFVEEFPKHSPLKLDMGKSCIRFKKPDQIPYELIAQLMQKMNVKEWIQLYESNLKL